MSAVLVALAAFSAWSLIGLGALVAVGADTRDLRVALTAPVVGTAATVILLFIVSHAGVAMDVGAPPVVGVLLGSSALAVALRRPRIRPAVIPVIALALIDLVLIGAPMFEYGFSWLANANSDMGNYVLAANRLLDHGLLARIDLVGLAHNRDYATGSRTLIAAGGRPGAYLTLAGFAAVTGRSATVLYMPMIVALNMGTVCAVGALAMQAARHWWAASIAAAMLVASPLAAYGVLQQLMPQVWGLGLAAALFAWLMRVEVHEQKGPTIPDLLVVVLLAIALILVYIELAASLSIAYVLYVALLMARRRVSFRALFLLWGVPVASALILLNSYLFRELHFLRLATDNGVSTAGGLPLFGYALVPTALPGVAGLQLLAASPSAPFMTVSIAVSAVLLTGALIVSLVTASKGAAASVVLLGDVALGALLAYERSDFGLFKLYMYVQPFLAAGVAVWLSAITRRWLLLITAVAVAVLFGFQLKTTSSYVDQSRNPIDLPNASASSLLPAFEHSIKTSADPVIAATDNVALMILEAANIGDKPLYFISRDITSSLLVSASSSSKKKQSAFLSPWKRRKFDVRTPTGGMETDDFKQNVDTERVLASGRCVIDIPTGSEVTLNRRSLPEGSPALAALPCRAARDLLIFTVSTLGDSYTVPANSRAVSFWPLEHDYFDSGHTFAGFGRYALFQVIGPVSRVRLELDFTTTVIQNGSNQIPPAAAVGDARVRFPVVGVGSARVISPPIRPQMIGGQPYVLLDMGERGSLPAVRRAGLAGLWGGDVPLDPRILTSYVRDVSVVTNAQYRHLRAPSVLRGFPAALENPNLQYSGIFEDGWVGRDSYVVLTGGSPTELTIRAQIPARAGQHVEVLVNGRTVVSRAAPPGELSLRVAVPRSKYNRRVELRWAGTIPLESPDTRHAAALLTFIGLGRTNRAH